MPPTPDFANGFAQGSGVDCEGMIVVKLLSRRGLRPNVVGSARRDSEADRGTTRGKNGGNVAPGANEAAAPANTAALPAEATKDLVRLFKLLADATRLRILHFLVQQDELHVRALCDLLRQSQPAVSHHLSLLRMAGLIESRRQGKHNFYRLAPSGFQGALALVEGAMPQWRQRNGLAELLPD